jgi:hypothetical protein
MKLYNHEVAPNPRRVRIFAAEKGIELNCRISIFSRVKAARPSSSQRTHLVGYVRLIDAKASAVF